MRRGCGRLRGVAGGARDCEVRQVADEDNLALSSTVVRLYILVCQGAVSHGVPRSTGCVLHVRFSLLFVLCLPRAAEDAQRVRAGAKAVVQGHTALCCTKSRDESTLGG